MASEYLQWKYKDVKPDPPTQYSKKVLRRTWWEYNLKWVLLGIAAAVALGFLIRDMFFRTRPDYTVAYITSGTIPNETRERLQQELGAMGEDVNGDGKVVVELSLYEIGFDEQGVMNVEQYSAGVTRLTADLSTRDIFVFILDDPEGFQGRLGGLCFLDGTAADREKGCEPERWQEMVYRWADCPAVADLDLGTFTTLNEAGEPIEVYGQTVLGTMYLGRREVYPGEKEESYAPGLALWEKLTAGAVRIK